MTIAAVLKPIINCMFLIQYYVLIALVFVKKIIFKLTGHPESINDDFSCHPFDSVHPHVFIHSRMYFFDI